MGKLQDFKTNTVDFAEKVGLDVKDLRTRISNLINDSVTSINSTWSSSKITSEIQVAISNSSHLTREVVQSKPQNPSENVIYLIPQDNPVTENIYDEWMFIDGDWELIGSTETSLTGYVHENDIPGLLGLESDASSGMGLTSNNFTNTLKTKLEGIVLASQQEAENATSTTLYMSPKRVEQYVDKQVGDADPLYIYNLNAGN